MGFNISRRSILKSVTGATVAGSAGCLQFVQSEPEREETDGEGPTNTTENTEESSQSDPLVSVETVSLESESDFSYIGYGAGAIAEGFIGEDGDLFKAVNTDGTVRWESNPIASEFRQISPDDASAVTNNRAYLCAWSESEAKVRLLAVDRGTGETLWTVSFEDREIGLIGGLGATEDGCVIALNRTDPDSEGTIVAVDGSGDELWSETVDELVAGVIEYQGDLFVMSYSTLFQVAVGENSGLTQVVNLDRNQSAGSHLLAQDVARRDNVIYPRGTKVVAIDLSDGAVLWSREPDYELGNSAGPAVISDLVVTGTKSGYVLAFDNESGDLRWTNRIEGSIQPHSDFIADGEYVWLGDDTGRVYGFTAGGELVHQRRVPEDQQGYTPSVTGINGTLLINGASPAYRVVE